MRVLTASHRDVAKRLLSRPAYVNRGWLSTNLTWRSADLFKLEVLSEARVDIEGAADALGRKPSTLVHKARELHLPLAPHWHAVVKTKRAKTAPRVDLQYPYIVKSRAEHDDILAINALVPRSIDGNMRADICQEILLAVLEGRVTIEGLRAREGTAGYYIRQFYKDNFEQGGHALSFSVADDDRSYDEVASSIAAKDWHHGQLVERHRGAYLPTTYTAPTQFDAAWRDQVGGVHMAMHELEQFLSFEEVEELMDAESEAA